MQEEKAVVPVDVGPPISLLSGSPPQRISEATDVANALSGVIDKKRLYATIGGKKHVLFEGWTTLGALLGVFPVTVWTRKTEDGWEARVEARTLAGAIVGAAEATCSREESNWKGRDDYALRSMSQTRAGAKALRMPLGFIMALAGYEATPAEEIPESTPKTATGDGESKTLMTQAKRQWPDRDPHSATCEALNLPEIKSGAIRDHWLSNGGTYPLAQAHIAEVRRLEVEGTPLADAIKEVDAYGNLCASSRTG